MLPDFVNKGAELHERLVKSPLLCRPALWTALLWDLTHFSEDVGVLCSWDKSNRRILRRKAMTWIGFFFFSIVFKCSCLHFLPSILPTPPIPTSLSPSYPPLALSMCPLYMFLDDPYPLFPSHLPSGQGHCVYFNDSGYILFACLFYWLGSTYRWDHVVFVFHLLAYFT